MQGLIRMFARLGSSYDEAHPRPLPIDGHAYHRRRRGRRRQ